MMMLMMLMRQDSPAAPPSNQTGAIDQSVAPLCLVCLEAPEFSSTTWSWHWARFGCWRYSGPNFCRFVRGRPSQHSFFHPFFRLAIIHQDLLPQLDMCLTFLCVILAATVTVYMNTDVHMDGVGLPWLIQIFTARCSGRLTLKDHHLFQRHLQVKMCLRCSKNIIPSKKLRKPHAISLETWKVSCLH